MDAKPSPRIVVVDVRPPYNPSSEENKVDEAFPKIAFASAVMPPELEIEKSVLPSESLILKILADWLGAARSVSAVAFDVVDSAVKTDVLSGVVVPIADWPVPLTLPATCANAEEAMR